METLTKGFGRLQASLVFPKDPQIVGGGGQGRFSLQALLLLPGASLQGLHSAQDEAEA